MKTALTWIFISFWAVLGIAQNPVFTASTDAKEIVTGGYVEVRFTLYNAEGKNFKPPSFSGFKVISGPNRSSQVTIVNGQTSQQMGLSYTLLAMNEGSYNIGSASIQVGNTRMASKPLQIKVLKGRPANPAIGPDGLPSEEMVFVRAEISDTIAYIGQQILLNYKLYTTEDIQNIDITSQPDFDGFYVENVKDFRNTFNREVIDGIQYRTRILKTFALFPQRTGSFTFESMYLKLGIPFKDKNSRSFFFNTRVRAMPVVTNDIDLEIKSLPDGAPESFSGGVGRFTMRSSINSNRLSTDDAVLISMHVTGNGDGRKISPPDFEVPAQFEMYDPKTIKDENVVKNGNMINYKIYEFVALPLEKGRFQIQPEFTYFDIDSSAYRTITSGPFQLNITKGTRPKSESHSFISGIESSEMRPPKTDFKSSKMQTGFYGSPAFWTFGSVFLLSFLSIIGVKTYKSNQAEIDPIRLKKENANKLALEKLSQAKIQMDGGNERSFYEEIALAFWGYATDKLGIDISEISKDVLSGRLNSMNVEEQVVADYIKVLNECEKVNYAGVANTDMQGFYDHCTNLISTIEAQL